MTPPTPKDALAGPSVVARADALMQRRRAQQQTAGSDDVPVLTEAVSLPEDDDFPVLTAIDAEPLPAAPAVPAPPAGISPETFDKLAQELTRTITARLNAELPHLVHIALQETLTHIEEELKSGIGAATDAALRDFLKEQGKRRKP